MAKRNKEAVMLQAINISQLSEGYVGKAIDREILRVVNDINARKDRKVRKVAVVLSFTPEDEGLATVDCEVKATLPAYKVPKTTVKIDGNGGFMAFSPNCADNPDQMTLPSGEIVDG